MTIEIFEYRRQARGPRNYFALGLATSVLYLAWSQGWGLIAVLLCGPFLGLVTARLIENEAEGFRMTPSGLDYYDADGEGELDWHQLSGVTLTGDGAGGARCLLHLPGGQSVTMPATEAFAPERLAQEFRLRGVPVWRATAVPVALAAA